MFEYRVRFWKKSRVRALALKFLEKCLKSKNHFKATWKVFDNTKPKKMLENCLIIIENLNVQNVQTKKTEKDIAMLRDA